MDEYPSPLFFVSFDKTVSLHSEDIESDALLTIRLSLNAVLGDGSDVRVGGLNAYKIHDSLENYCNINRYDLFGAESADLEHMASHVFTKSGEFRAKINQLFEYAYLPEVIFVDKVYVIPALRGNGFGLLLVDRLLDLESPDLGVVVLDPLPESHYFSESKERRPLQPQERAINKLTSYYERIGFTQIPHSRYVGLDASKKRTKAHDIGFTMDLIEDKWYEGLDRLIYEQSHLVAKSLGGKALSEFNFAGDAEQLQRVIDKGESEICEFKSSFCSDPYSGDASDRLREKVCISVCALLNARGGHVILGVGDNGDILGIDRDLSLYGSEDKLRHAVQETIDSRLSPRPIYLYQIDIVKHKGKSLLIISVARQREDRFSINDQVYVRRSASSAPPLTPNEVAQWWHRRRIGLA